MWNYVKLKKDKIPQKYFVEKMIDLRSIKFHQHFFRGNM